MVGFAIVVLMPSLSVVKLLLLDVDNVNGNAELDCWLCGCCAIEFGIVTIAGSLGTQTNVCCK